jgi:uncharacterized damage-inducible protein DinB
MTADDARLHLRYSTWASRKLVEAARKLSPEDLGRSVGISHGSLLGTLGHIQFADWIWYTRAVGPLDRPETSLAALEQYWPELQRKWEAWSDSLKDEDLNRIIAYKTTDGQPFQTPVWRVVLHVVNHATLHRGQAMGMLRQMGIAPPPTDLMIYYRELDAAKTA